MFFFQTALLLGYLVAYRLARSQFNVQRNTVLVLAVLAPFSLRLPLIRLGAEADSQSLLSTLALSLGPQLLFTTSIGIVIQTWIQRQKGVVPYYLYAISNVGSLIALISYPFLIEPLVTLETQIHVVRSMSFILSIVSIALACTINRKIPSTENLLPIPKETLTFSQKGYWLTLSFLNCVMMLGATRVLSAEFGSNPLTWIIPLSFYLISFTVTFTSWWNRYASMASLVVLCVALPCYMLGKGIMSVPLEGNTLPALLFIVAAGSLLGNSLLFGKRPQSHFASFYLVIALGGALGGFFASLSAPSVFDRNYEFLGSAVGITLAGAAEFLTIRSLFPRFAVGIAIVAPLITIGRAQLDADNSGGLRTLHLRNQYGQIVVRALHDQRKCASETTIHGSEFTDPARLRIPTSYYAEGSAIGQLVRHLQSEKPALHIGIIGLGVGTLATYLRPSDSILFWEIDPLIRDVALNLFDFISKSDGKIELHMMDGRLGVKAESRTFDLIVVDAFSGDSIPLHLITREAMQAYVDKTPGGIVAVNISNRYSDLFPVIAAHARALGLHARAIYSAPPPNPDPNDLLSNPSRYVIVSSFDIDAKIIKLIEAAGEKNGWTYRSIDVPPKYVEWTDSRCSILDVLDVKTAFHRK